MDENLEKVIKLCDGVLENDSREKKIMNLNNKSINELDQYELKQEIAYLEGEKDCTAKCIYTPDDVKIRRLQNLDLKINRLLVRLLFILEQEFESINNLVEKD